MKEIIQKIKPGKDILLFLDYDGTLVPIKKSPELAVLHPLRRKLLKSLRDKVFLSIVSGRALLEIKKFVGIDNIDYIGNHGLEISCKHWHWVHPQAKRINPILKDALRRISLKTKDLQGVFIEDKGVTGSIHYRRLAPKMCNPLKKIIHEEVGFGNRGLKITEGKRVFEIRPKVEWDKGKAVLKLIRWLNLKETPLSIYVGDDETDEDAFRAFDKDALTILVGQRNDSNAHYQLHDVHEVWKFLKALFQVVALKK
jgi:trehalose 6-phosphate phosphatase